jgi:hypothetical protein
MRWKIDGRPRFAARHDLTARKIRFTWRRVVVAPIIPLDSCASWLRLLILLFLLFIFWWIDPISHNHNSTNYTEMVCNSLLGWCGRPLLYVALSWNQRIAWFLRCWFNLLLGFVPCAKRNNEHDEVSPNCSMNAAISSLRYFLMCTFAFHFVSNYYFILFNAGISLLRVDTLYIPLSSHI